MPPLLSEDEMDAMDSGDESDMVMRPAVTYTPCATSLRGKTGNTITFAQFEEGNI